MFPSELVMVAEAMKADIVGASSLLTTTMVRHRSVVEALADLGLRPKVKVMVGEEPLTCYRRHRLRKQPEAWLSELGFKGQTSSR